MQIFFFFFELKKFFIDRIAMQKYGAHENSPISIFPKIYFEEIHITKLSIVLIFIFPIHHIT